MRDIRYWIEVIFRRRLTVQRVALIVVGLVALGSLVWPPLYESRSKILIQSSAAGLLVSPGVEQDTGNPRPVANPVSEEASIPRSRC
jgi:uncharacterized protein involved in exopolysaccharide biosynthesis